MLRYPHITGHALCVLAAGVGLYGSFFDRPGLLVVAAAAGVIGFFLLMGGAHALQSE
ncbi:hypothetical protein VLK31_07050 [Variovorax sp. H27-G14]|uniref:hypothetical protein n=1 Tax=Variovorax sp. H27-G14 TaxID=3111914 RepID=UPI0038FCAE8D